MIMVTCADGDLQGTSRTFTNVTLTCSCISVFNSKRCIFVLNWKLSRYLEGRSPGSKPKFDHSLHCPLQDLQLQTGGLSIRVISTSIIRVEAMWSPQKWTGSTEESSATVKQSPVVLGSSLRLQTYWALQQRFQPL